MRTGIFKSANGKTRCVEVAWYQSSGTIFELLHVFRHARCTHLEKNLKLLCLAPTRKYRKEYTRIYKYERWDSWKIKTIRCCFFQTKSSLRKGLEAKIKQNKNPLLRFYQLKECFEFLVVLQIFRKGLSGLTQRRCQCLYKIIGHKMVHVVLKNSCNLWHFQRNYRLIYAAGPLYRIQMIATDCKTNQNRIFRMDLILNIR